MASALSEVGTVLHEGRPSLPRNKVFSVIREDAALSYYAFVPEVFDPSRPPLVCIHGISRNAAEMAFAFSEQAARRGITLLAPIFTKARHRSFQKLAIGEGGLRSDIAFNRMLAHAHDTLGVGIEKVRMFGYSAGAQFAHRYTLINPERVAGQVLFAPGWYTFPTEQHAFPLGLGAPEGIELAPLHLAATLEIPTYVMVGTADTRRDPSLNSEPAVDELQGVNRLERARRWVTAMRQAAADRRKAPRVTLTEIPDATHLFSRNLGRLNLPAHVFDHLYGAAR